MCTSWLDDDFSLSLNKGTATFQFELDFAEGVDRLCWTPIGIEKLIKLGLWKGNLTIAAI
jgi:hypothetical protein